MSIELDTPPGDLVVFTGVGGYPLQNEAAHAALEVGHNYRVTDMRVGGWESSVALDGIEGRYNSVLFDNVVPHDVVVSEVKEAAHVLLDAWRAGYTEDADELAMDEFSGDPMPCFNGMIEKWLESLVSRND